MEGNNNKRCKQQQIWMIALKHWGNLGKDDSDNRRMAIVVNGSFMAAKFMVIALI